MVNTGAIKTQSHGLWPQPTQVRSSYELNFRSWSGDHSVAACTSTSDQIPTTCTISLSDHWTPISWNPLRDNVVLARVECIYPDYFLRTRSQDTRTQRR